MKFDFQAVIWDWNGTLLDDVDICISVMNQMLADRRLALLNRKRYRDIFTFPVQEYYKAIGFDFEKEPFSISGTEFIERYNQNVPSAVDLFPDVLPTLGFCAKKKMPQYVLSAMKHEMLLGHLTHYELLSYFEGVQGIGDVLASGKLQQGKKLIANSGMDAGQFCLIGDTLHDFEVAMDLGCQCILLAQGHQSEERLQTSGQKVFRNITALRLFLMNPA